MRILGEISLFGAGVFLLLAGAPSYARTGAPAYGSVTIVQPAKGATVFSNSGHVNVRVAVSPSLRTASGDRLELLLDGHEAAEQGATRLELSGIPRGTHMLEARVVDSDGNVIAASAPRKFYVWHASRLFPSRRAKQ